MYVWGKLSCQQSARLVIKIIILCFFFSHLYPKCYNFSCTFIFILRDPYWRTPLHIFSIWNIYKFRFREFTYRNIILYINYSTGNFHVSTHSADEQPKDIDFAHVIHEVRFGSKIDNPDVPGTFNPLLGRAKIDGNGK